VKGLYLYCIGNGPLKSSLGCNGIEAEEVYTLPYRDLSVVLQAFPLEDYELKDPEILTGWVQIYDEVLNIAWGKFGTIIPVKFGTVIKEKDGKSPEENLFFWLDKEYESFQMKLSRLQEKAEYGVQIFWDKKAFTEKICENSIEVKKLMEEISSKPQGIAYMLKKKLEAQLKKEVEKEAETTFKELYEKIRNAVDEIKVEKLKETKGKEMFMNVSCLINKNERSGLERALDEIEMEWDLEARLVGPFPPYSFV